MSAIVVTQISVNWNTCQSFMCVECVCVCRATNRHQGSVYSPHSFCPFFPANMAEKEVGTLAVEDGSGTCKAGFACDDASRVEFPSSGTDQEVSHVSDDVHSKRSVSTSKSLIEYAIVTNKHCEVTMPYPEKLFEELYTLSDGVTADVSDAWLSGDSLASACLTEVEVVAADVTVKGETDEVECPVKKRRKTIPAPAVKDWFLKRCCRARSRTFVHRRRVSLAPSRTRWMLPHRCICSSFFEGKTDACRPNRDSVSDQGGLSHKQSNRRSSFRADPTQEVSVETASWESDEDFALLETQAQAKHEASQIFISFAHAAQPAPAPLLTQEAP